LNDENSEELLDLNANLDENDEKSEKDIQS
jgi:hypothetical protein